MPILDLEVQMATDKTINYRWFKKPMATCYSILNRSAMPANTKRITLVQRGVTIRWCDEENAFSKHLAIHHPEREGDVRAFKFTLKEVHSKPLTRLCSESVHIHNNTCDIPMNSKAEWHQPVVARVVVTRELDELQVPGARGGRGGGRGRGMGHRTRGGV